MGATPNWKRTFSNTAMHLDADMDTLPVGTSSTGRRMLMGTENTRKLTVAGLWQPQLEGGALAVAASIAKRPGTWSCHP